MHFINITINEWQQFSNIDISFHERVTILTGGNDSGKTTVLSLLAKHMGWTHISLATPKTDTNGIVRFITRLFNGENKSNQNNIGNITYSNNSNAILQVNNTNTAQYQVQIQNQQTVKYFYIPSHRPIFRYHAINSIPVAKKNKSTAFNEVMESNKQRHMGGNSQPSSLLMKNTLIGWAIKGYGVQNNSKTVMPRDRTRVNLRALSRHLD